jgi:DeoR family transcriptional regulator, aga operon transcriptional repressor
MSDTPHPHPLATGDAEKELMTQQRRARIVATVQRLGSVRVGELASRFGVSEVTIRNDLVVLEKEGRLARDRGGAVAKESGRFVTSLLRVDERSALNHEAKRRIAMAAAGRVGSGDTILLDAGTTVVEMASSLTECVPLTVVTNALNVIMAFNRMPDVRLMCLGGTFHPESGSMVGLLAEHALGELTVQKLFLGAQALDLENGMTDSTTEIAQVKRAMLRSARQVILLADSSKWGRSGFIKVAPLSEVDTIISDDGLPPETRAAVERLGIELVIV